MFHMCNAFYLQNAAVTFDSMPKNHTATSEPESPGSVPALDRTLEMLELLGASSHGLTLSELSRRLDAPKNAVFRITQTLLARGYLYREADTMAFQLTGQFMRLAPARFGRVSLPEVSREAMTVLRDTTRETVQLGVLNGDEGVIIDQIEGLEPLRIVVDLGLRFALHNNAPGKLFLAYLPEQEREAMLSRIELTQSTSRTITAVSALRDECEKIKSRGFSTDYAEADEGIHCVAAPIFGANGSDTAGALWVSGPAKRLPKSRFREIGAEVKAAGDRISQQIAIMS